MCGLDDFDELNTALAVGAEKTSLGGSDLSVGAIFILTVDGDGGILSALYISKVELQAADTKPDDDPLEPFGYFGSAVTQVGNLNLGSCQEIAVGANGASRTAGLVYILFLQTSGTKCATGENFGVQSWQRIAPPSLVSGDEFGSALAAPGDLNADGVPDLIVGAPGANSGLGAVYLILLTDDGTMLSYVELSSSTGRVSALPEAARFGSALSVAPADSSNAGRMRRALENAEAASTLAVGAPNVDNPGAVYVMDITAALDESGPIHLLATLHAPQELADDSAFGAALSYAADYDANGSPELVVGAPNADGIGAVFILYLQNSSSSAYEYVRIDPTGQSATEFGRAIADLGQVNTDGPGELIVGQNDQFPNPNTGSAALLFLATTATSDDPSPPPPTESSALVGATSDGALIGLWVILPILAFLILTWFFYFRCMRKHQLKDFYSTNYFFGPAESAWAAVKQGKITPTCRLELRGSASARRARSVRALPPTDLEQIKDPPKHGLSAAGAPMLDPDVLLNVCYAPNVPQGEGGPAMPGAYPAAPPIMSPRLIAPRVVDLSEATESLLRGDAEVAPSTVHIGYAPNYAQNVPNSGFTAPSATDQLIPPRRGVVTTMGGLSAVAEEDRTGTWGQYDGQDSQATWITDEEPVQIPPGVLPRSPGTLQTLPSPRESNPALLRI